MIFVPFLSFLSGFLVKWVDWIDDDKEGRDKAKFFLATMYGAIIGYLSSLPGISELFIGTLLAQVFTRKVDTLAHGIGFLTAVLVLLFFGLPQQSFIYLFIFFVLAALDEQTSIWSFKNFENYRLLLPLGALIVGVLTQQWWYLISIISFDIGYLLFKKIEGRMVLLWPR